MKPLKIKRKEFQNCGNVRLLPFRSFFAVSVEQHSVFQALPFNSTERNAVTWNGGKGGEGTEMRIVSKSGRLLTGHVHRKPREQFLRSFVSELLSLLSYSRLALPVWNLIRFLQVYLSLVVLTNFSYSNFLWLIFFFF